MILAYILILVLACHICLYKVIWAENVGVRIAAADALGVIIVVILALLSALLDAVYLLDIAIVYAMLLFLDVLVLSKFFEKGLLHR